MNYQQINAETVDRWCSEGWTWGTPITHDAYLRAMEGDYQLYLTPTRTVPKAWLGNLQGAQVLGLASGGGQQMPVLSAQGGALHPAGLLRAAM